MSRPGSGRSDPDRGPISRIRAAASAASIRLGRSALGLRLGPPRCGGTDVAINSGTMKPIAMIRRMLLGLAGSAIAVLAMRAALG